MSTYIDYCVDHDLDTSSIKNMILDLESRLGYKLQWLSECTSNAKNGFFLSWDVYWDENGKLIDHYDKNTDQPTSAVRIEFFKNNKQLFELAVFPHIFDIWVEEDEYRFPLGFRWFTFLRHFLGSPSENITRDEEIREKTYKVLHFYQTVLTPFHPKFFIAHGEEDSWVELAEDGKCSLEELLNYRIDDKYLPIPVNKNTTFTYYSDYGTTEENCALVFVEHFDKNLST